MDLYDEFFSLIEAFDAAAVPYAVCGGIAVAIHGFPRFTEDIDLLIHPSDEQRALQAAAARQFTLEGGRLPMGNGEDSKWEIVRVSKIVGKSLLTLDLMLAAEEVQLAWNDRAVVEYSGKRVSVVSRPGLKLLKQLAGRRKDLLDLEQLGLTDEADH
ncbi:MAG: hypothetical protein NTZ32_06480 [Planctomycetales bacterium]|nr:hypothetical protein [Planctomycetales bacterium]